MPEPPAYPSRYAEVAADLRDRIAAGEFTGRLPSEKVLLSEYRISQITLRPALAILEAEGLLQRQQGARHRILSAPERTIVFVDVPGPEEIELEVGPATAADRAELGLPVGAWVIRIWDLGRLDPDGNPTLWQRLPAISTKLRFGPNPDDQEQDEQ